MSGKRTVFRKKGGLRRGILMQKEVCTKLATGLNEWKKDSFQKDIRPAGGYTGSKKVRMNLSVT